MRFRDDQFAIGQRILLAVSAACLLIALVTARPAYAEWDAQRPITIIVPFGPGSGIDAGGRFIAESLSERLKQPVIVENRPGAGGMVGASYVAKADPDGHTLLLIDTSTILQDWLHKNVPFDVMKDFTPIASVVTSPLVLFANKSFGPNTIPELIALAKKEPGKLSAGTAGVGTPHHLALLMLNSMAGIDVVNVPYNSAAASVNDLLAGQIPMAWAGPTAAILSQQTVGVLIAAALPRAVWIAEIDLHIGSDGETLVVGHLLAAIPGQGAAQLLRQFAHMFRERADHGCGVPARDLEKHHKAGMALDERRDV